MLYSWLPPHHPALGPFDPRQYPHQLQMLSDSARSRLVSSQSDDSPVIPDWIVGQRVHVDYLTYTVPRRSIPVLGGALECVADDDYIIAVQPWLPVGVRLGRKLTSGRNFYSVAWSLVDAADNECGFVATGGNNDTLCVNLSGSGCALVHDWHAVSGAIQQMQGVITRLDLALDDYTGRMGAITKSVGAYKQGLFQFRDGGRPPSISQVGNWIRPDEGSGRTLYIGSRSSGKLARIYEKGRQLGVPGSPWVRYEVELRRGNGREISVDMLTSRDAHFAGLYPFFGHLLAGFNEAAVPWESTRAIVAKVTLERLIFWARIQYGRLFGVLSALGRDAESIVRDLSRDGIPRRLCLPVPEAARSFLDLSPLTNRGVNLTSGSGVASLVPVPF